jgi:hypothetical protein
MDGVGGRPVGSGAQRKVAAALAAWDSAKAEASLRYLHKAPVAISRNPRGMAENSPAFQRRGLPQRMPSPEGTAE